MEIELKLTKSNGASEAVKRDLTRLPDAYMLCGVVFDVRETSYDSEFVIYFQPENDIALSKFEISAEFDPSGAFVYDAGVSTNSWARVISADVPVSFSRNVFMAANPYPDDPGKTFTFNFAFTSFERFFTFFTYVPGKISAVFDLENRTVPAGRIFRLENIMIDDTVDAGTFFACAAETTARHQKIRKPFGIPYGWSSWSCYYGAIDEEKIVSQTVALSGLLKRLPGGNIRGGAFPVVQIDDGWQAGKSFSLNRNASEEKFPGGIGSVSGDAASRGIETGLWFAPGLIEEDSEDFSGNAYRLYTEKNPVPSFANIYPLNIGSSELLRETGDIIRTASEKYGVSYFKLDFLDSLLYRQDAGHSRVVYADDYSVALFRRFIKTIRNYAGVNSFLLASGGPIGECAGVFDAIRVTPDVTWEGAGSGGRPDAWSVICANIRNMMYRSYYNGVVFRNDPDFVVLRDSYGGYGDDGAAFSDNEAMLLCIACAFSGGSIISGDDLEKLPEKRKEMLLRILPPSGIACRPVDFWEYPYCTHTVAVIPDKSVRTEMHVFYNLDDFSDEKILKATEPSLFHDAVTGELLACGQSFLSFSLPARSARAILVKELPRTPAFMWTNENIYCGCANTSDMYFSGSLIITSDAPQGTAVDIFVPYGSNGDIYLNEKKLRISTLEARDAGEGNIYSAVL